MRHRNLISDTKQNRKAVHAMISWVRSEVQSAGIPVIELNEHAQIGASFGDRLTNGVSALFQDGADQIIIIGNDSPGLTSEDLVTAKENLDQGIQVMGHSLLGGAWMIGLRKENFDAQAFRQLPWQTKSLGDSLEVLLRSQGEMIRLRTLRELQDSKSLRDHLQAEREHGFVRIVLNILGQQPITYWNSQLNHLAVAIVSPSLRAPPLVV